MRRSALRWVVVIALGTGIVSMAACGSDGGTPASPTAGNPPTTSPPPNTASVLSCGSIVYRGETRNVSCQVPGQSQQPTAVHLLFPNRTDCVQVTCSAGCATAARVGTVVGDRCQ
jgi:hypothetical protein